jgi:hypothetical protein
VLHAKSACGALRLRRLRYESPRLVGPGLNGDRRRRRDLLPRSGEVDQRLGDDHPVLVAEVAQPSALRVQLPQRMCIRAGEQGPRRAGRRVPRGVDSASASADLARVAPRSPPRRHALQERQSSRANRRAVKPLERIEDARRQLALRRDAEQREEIAVVRSIHRPGACGQHDRARRAARPRATALRLHDLTSAAREMSRVTVGAATESTEDCRVV